MIAKYLVQFGVVFVGAFVAQLAQIQTAVNAGDWNAAKKLGLAALLSAVVTAVTVGYDLLKQQAAPAPPAPVAAAPKKRAAHKP